ELDAVADQAASRQVPRLRRLASLDAVTARQHRFGQMAADDPGVERGRKAGKLVRQRASQRVERSSLDQVQSAGVGRRAIRSSSTESAQAVRAGFSCCQLFTTTRARVT